MKVQRLYPVEYHYQLFDDPSGSSVPTSAAQRKSELSQHLSINRPDLIVVDIVIEPAAVTTLREGKSWVAKVIGMETRRPIGAKNKHSLAGSST